MFDAGSGCGGRATGGAGVAGAGGCRSGGGFGQGGLGGGPRPRRAVIPGVGVDGGGEGEFVADVVEHGVEGGAQEDGFGEADGSRCSWRGGVP